MDDALVVRGRQGIGDLPRDGEDFGDADAPRFDAVRERRSLHQLQHERGRGALLLDPVDAGDVRMVERGQHPRFALEPREAVGV